MPVIKTKPDYITVSFNALYLLNMRELYVYCHLSMYASNYPDNTPFQVPANFHEEIRMSKKSYDKAFKALLDLEYFRLSEGE